MLAANQWLSLVHQIAKIRTKFIAPRAVSRLALLRAAAVRVPRGPGAAASPVPSKSARQSIFLRATSQAAGARNQYACGRGARPSAAYLNTSLHSLLRGRSTTAVGIFSRTGCGSRLVFEWTPPGSPRIDWSMLCLRGRFRGAGARSRCMGEPNCEASVQRK